MKKFVAVLCIMTAFVCCSCTVDTSGYSYELKSSSWKAKLDGGGCAELVFDGDTAVLTLENCGLKKQISGKCIADEASFIIFDESLSYNYKFDYVPSGDTLTITYNDMQLVLTAVEN